MLDAFAPQSFMATIRDESRSIILAEHEAALVAFSEIAFDVPCPQRPVVTTEVTRLYVQRPFMRTGLGTALLHASADLAAERAGSRAFWLSVYSGNHAALAFYEKYGLVQVGTCSFELGSATHENRVLVMNDR